MQTIAEFDFLSTLLGIVVSVSIIGGIVIHFIKKTNENLKKTRINDCKNYLVAFLADVENGERMSVEEIERAYEVYEEYSDPDDLNQNHYVADQWERLMKPRVEYEKEVKINRK